MRGGDLKSSLKDSFISDDQLRKELSYRELFIRLWPEMRKEKSLLFLGLGSVLLLAVVSRMLPNLFGYAIDHGIVKNNFKIIITTALFYFILEVLRSSFMFSHRYWFSRLGNRVMYSLRERVVDHVQHLPITFFDRHPVGRIVTRVTNDVSTLGELFNKGLVSIITHIISLFAIFIAMLFISVKLTLVTLILVPPLFFIVSKLSKKLKKALQESKKSLARINAFVSENLSGMKVVQLYHCEQKNLFKFRWLTKEYRTTQLKAVKYYALLWPSLNFFNAITIATALFFGGYLRAENMIPIGLLIAFFMHLQDFYSPLQSILDTYSQLQNSLTSAERIFQLLDETKESDRGGQYSEKLKGAIEFKDLFFRYSEQLPWALASFNLRISPGESVALIGKTGSGKSTTISLIQKFYECTKGKIFIDGKNISEIHAQSLRRHIGVIQQENFLFRGTFADNISLHQPFISEEKIQWAVKQACCEHIINNYPLGLKTLVEERGANLSAGERQLISFARIFAFDPDILILDEATAHIDSYSESLIQKATQEITKNRTSIIIAHRLSTILHCDTIVLIDQGRIIEIGNHEELINKKGAYHDLYHAQFRISSPNEFSGFSSHS